MTHQSIRANAEPFSFAGNDTGVLLIHGFFGTPDELRPLGAFLAAHGFGVDGVLLARHGGSPAMQFGVRWMEWLASAERAMQRLCAMYRRVVLVGFSMGALLACHLAARYPTAGLVLLAPALKLYNEPLFRLAGAAQYVVPWLYPLWRADFTNNAVQDSVREFLPDADFSDAATRKMIVREARIPTGALYELVRLQSVVKRNLWRITTPLLVLQGRRDRTVVPVAAEIAYGRVASSDTTLVWFERSGHLLPKDVERERVYTVTADWIAAHSRS